MSLYQEESFDNKGMLMIKDGKHSFVKLKYVKDEINYECIKNNVFIPYFIPIKAKKKLLEKFPTCKFLCDCLKNTKYGIIYDKSLPIN